MEIKGKRWHFRPRSRKKLKSGLSSRVFQTNLYIDAEDGESGSVSCLAFSDRLRRHLISEYFLYPVNHLPRLIHYFFQQSLKYLSGGVLHVHLAFFRLVNQAGIFHCFSVGVAQNFHPIWRRPRTGDHRTTEVSAGENYTRQLAPHIGSLVLIHQLKERRRIGQSRVPFWPTLKDMPVKTVLVPGIKRFATEVWRDIHATAHDLAALHRHIHLTTSLVAGHRLQLGLQIFFHQFGQEIAGAGGSRCSTFGGLAGLDDIRDRFIGRIRSKIEHDRSFFLGPDPFELAHIELDFFTFDELSKVQAVDGHEQG